MITFKEYLAELFNKPWSKTLDKEKSQKARDIYRNSDIHKNDSIVHTQVWKLEGNNGHMVSYRRNGCLEVHHIDKDGNSGHMTQGTKPNPRFISTMKHHLETEGLDKGRPIRMIAKEDKMADHYHRIANRIADKRGGLDVHRYKSKIGEHDVHCIEVHHKQVLPEMTLLITGKTLLEAIQEQNKELFDYVKFLGQSGIPD